MPTIWNKLGRLVAIIAGVFAVLKALALVVVLGLVVAYCSPEWQHSEAIYLRNRTGAPMLLTLTVSRAALQADTVWWGTYPRNSFSYGEIGCARRLTSVNVEGLRYPTPSFLPALLHGTATSLVFRRGSDPYEHGYVPRWDLEPWLTRQQQPAPTSQQLAQAVVLRPRPGAPDSVRLTFRLAADSSFRVALRAERLHHSDPDQIELTEAILRPTVQWIDSLGRHRRQQAPLGAWLREQDALAEQEHGQNYQLTYYADYR